MTDEINKIHSHSKQFNVIKLMYEGQKTKNKKFKNNLQKNEKKICHFSTAQAQTFWFTLQNIMIS